MILFVNGCVREESRTEYMARKLLNKLGEYEEIRISEEGLKPLDKDTLEYRTQLIAEGNYKDPIFRYAKQFASADTIVIAVPYWDLSFPAILKTYIENIYVTGIVSKYGEDGRPVGLCRAKRLYYVTTAGGPYDGRFSYEYIREMAVHYFGIGEVELIEAEMLDIVGNDAKQIVREQLKLYGLEA